MMILYHFFYSFFHFFPKWVGRKYFFCNRKTRFLLWLLPSILLIYFMLCVLVNKLVSIYILKCKKALSLRMIFIYSIHENLPWNLVKTQNKYGETRGYPSFQGKLFASCVQRFSSCPPIDWLASVWWVFRFSAMWWWSFRG